ncbi:MAG: hypothetical protein HRU69_11670 [Flammeovirgaceae bacterium]|nr:MAG: hypothetical protein HRU69_11670 [Flammeovirgaceae bacterium]
MRIPAALLSVILAVSACTHQPRKKEVETIEQKAEVKKIIPPPDEATAYQLSNSEPRQWLEDYRFGKFFQERAEFFVIQSPKSKIFDSPVSRIILYYLDGEHCQSRFILTENVANKIIAQYGTFSITPLDGNNKTALENQPIMIDDNGQRMLNRS